MDSSLPVRPGALSSLSSSSPWVHFTIHPLIRQRRGLHHQREKSDRGIGYEGVTSRKSYPNGRSWLTTALSRR